jgi:hypothetical protein
MEGKEKSGAPPRFGSIGSGHMIPRNPPRLSGKLQAQFRFPDIFPDAKSVMLEYWFDAGPSCRQPPLQMDKLFGTVEEPLWAIIRERPFPPISDWKTCSASEHS